MGLACAPTGSCFKWLNLLNLSAVSLLLLLLTFLNYWSIKGLAEAQGSLMLGVIKKTSCVPDIKRDNRWIAGSKQSGSDRILNHMIATVSVHSPSQHWRNLRNYESLWRHSDRHKGEHMKELEEICLTV